MDQNIHTAINWLDYDQLTRILICNGLAIGYRDGEHDLRDAVRESVENGKISKDTLLSWK